MEKDLYTALRSHIETQLGDRIKYVRLFNNQFIRSNGAKPDQQGFRYPCVFIEFRDPTFSDLSQGVQAFDTVIRLHLGFESYKDEDIEVLQLKQDLYKAVQLFQQDYHSKLTRITQSQDFNHNNIQIYTTDYKVHGKDYTATPNYTTTNPALVVSATTATYSGITI